MDFNSLPVELRFQIFSHFTPQELCTIIAPVCKQWSKISREPILWKTIEITKGKISTEQIPRILKQNQCSLAREVIFNKISEFEWMSTLSPMESVRQLGLSLCLLFAETLRGLVALFPFVSTLEIDIDHFIDKSIIESITQWKYLKVITINFNFYDDDDYLPVITKQCTCLEELAILESHCIQESSILEFVKIRGPKLKSLSFGNATNLTTKCLRALTGCPNLSTLMLIRPFKLIIDDLLILREFKKLTTFKIYPVESLFSDKFLSTFCDVTFPNIISFTVSCCGINDDVLAAIIKCFPSLEHLEIAFTNNITDRGLEPLYNNSRKLKTLILHTVPHITEDCLDKLQSSFPYLGIVAKFCPQVSAARYSAVVI